LKNQAENYEKIKNNEIPLDPLNKYNVQLIEDIYDAYPTEQADRIVEKFRKGGLFSVEPIKEEELEYSVDGIDANDLD
jgi:hypothetical protein